MCPWALVVIPLIDTGNPVLYAVAIVGMCAIGGIGSGPTGAFIPELFATRYRYSGSALAINLAGVLGGALPPLIAGTRAGDLRQLGHRADAGRARPGRAGVHLSTSRDQGNRTSVYSKHRRAASAPRTRII